MTLHLILPPDMPDRQREALEAIERRAFAYRGSVEGQLHQRAREASLKGWKGRRSA